ncbi:MAG: TonB-dependent receptor [Tenacibaculum sp.]
MSLAITAQKFTLSGKVVNQNRERLKGATIFIASLKKGVLSDSEGNFNIALPKGIYNVELSFMGYVPLMQRVELNDNKTLLFKLRSNNFVLDQALVSAVRVKDDAPISHVNLTKEEISQRNLGQDLPVLLNYLPSVTYSSDAGAGIGYTYMRIRGTDATRTNVTINGIPYNDAESQGSFWVNLADFASSVQNLQVQRGVGTSTNGAAAFGASINILTDAISEEAKAEISNSFGSYSSRKHTLKFSTGKISDKYELAGRLSNIYSDGYIDRAFSDLKSYFLQGSYQGDKTLIKALVFGGKEKTYQAWFGLSAEQLAEDRRQNPYTYDNETDNYWQDHYQLHWNERFSNNWSVNLGLNFTRGKGYFEQFKENSPVVAYNAIVEPTEIDAFGLPVTDLIVRRWLDNKFYVLTAGIEYKKNKLEITNGFLYSKYKGEHFGEVIWAKKFADKASIRDRYYFSKALKQDFSIFSKATFAISAKLKAFLDLQGRVIIYKTDELTSDINPIDINSRFNFFNPKFGLTYNIDKQNSLYASYARANREPNRNDFENGQNVKHETLNDCELGWRLNNRKIMLNANLYYMLYKNQLIETGGLNDVGAYLRENIKDSYRFGLELNAKMKISDKLELSQNITLSSNKINNFILNRDGVQQNIGTTNIAFSPNIIAGNTTTYQVSSKLHFALLSKYVGEQYLSNTDTEASKLSSYYTSDFTVSYEFKMQHLFKSILFTGLINNMFNKEYTDRGYTYLNTWTGPKSFEVQGYYPQATRNFLIGINLSF